MGLLFTADTHAALASGDVTVTFRAWKRAQVKVGGRYRVGGLVLVVDGLREVRVGDITRADARRAGSPDLDALRRRLARGGSPVGDETTVWRVDFHLGDPDATRVSEEAGAPTPGEIEEIARRLNRLDNMSACGPWTGATLRLIGKRPGVVSTRLAEELGRDRASLKADVRKLKRLDLTVSLEVGYELSPRGAAVLASIGKRRGPHSKNVGTFSNS